MAQDATRRSYETDEEREHPILATSMNDGEAVWQEFVRKHSNILLVISGHRGVSTIPYNVAIGDHGNRVYELLADYQWEPEGGSGYLVVLRFSGDGTIAVQAYSPYLDAYKQDRDSYGFDNDFVIDVGAGVVR
ncbi:MAG TPA: hypothetical protein GX513_07425 [Firmicutes bacterium]|nr:hypothetical protein [Bacillota bacterium]